MRVTHPNFCNNSHFPCAWYKCHPSIIDIIILFFSKVVTVAVLNSLPKFKVTFNISRSDLHLLETQVIRQKPSLVEWYLCEYDRCGDNIQRSYFCFIILLRCLILLLLQHLIFLFFLTLLSSPQSLSFCSSLPSSPPPPPPPSMFSSLLAPKIKPSGYGRANPYFINKNLIYLYKNDQPPRITDISRYSAGL